MNKKLKIFMNIMIVVASLVFIISFVDMLGSFDYVKKQEEKAADDSFISVFEYELKHKAYNDILETYYVKRLDEMEAPEGYENIWNVAEYSHYAFMARIYEAKGDKDRLDACAAKLEVLRSGLGDYKTAASDVDEVIMNVIGLTYNK